MYEIVRVEFGGEAEGKVGLWYCLMWFSLFFMYDETAFDICVWQKSGEKRGSLIETSDVVLWEMKSFPTSNRQLSWQTLQHTHTHTHTPTYTRFSLCMKFSSQGAGVLIKKFRFRDSGPTVSEIQAIFRVMMWILIHSMHRLKPDGSSTPSFSPQGCWVTGMDTHTHTHTDTHTGKYVKPNVFTFLWMQEDYY